MTPTEYHDFDLDWLQANDRNKKPTQEEREAWHKAAIKQAGEYVRRHPELVDDYSDADPGL